MGSVSAVAARKGVASSGVAGSSVTPPIPISLPVVQTGEITFANAAEKFASIPRVAWQRVQSVIAATSAVTVPTSLWIGPTTGTTKSQIQTLLNKEYKLFKGFSRPANVLAVTYNGADERWAERTLAAVVAFKKYSVNTSFMTTNVMRNACDLANPSGPVCASGYSFVPGKSPDAVILYGVEEPFWTVAQQAVGPMSQVTHEYTHQVQFAQWIGVPLKAGENIRSDSAHNKFPCWFSEGQANGIGITVWAPTLEAYVSARNNSVTRPVNLSGPQPTLTSYTAADFTKFLADQNPLTCYNSGTNGDYQLGYSVGFAATEALIAIGGPRATMALLARTARGDSWATAFKAVYGISWAYGAVYLGRVLAAEYAALPFGGGD